MDEKIKAIAQRIMGLREICDISSAQIAKRLNMDETKYLEYEEGKHDFTFSILYSIANILNVDIVDLMTGEAPKLQVCSLVRRGEGLQMERKKRV